MPIDGGGGSPPGRDVERRSSARARFNILGGRRPIQRSQSHPLGPHAAGELIMGVKRATPGLP